MYKMHHAYTQRERETMITNTMNDCPNRVKTRAYKKYGAIPDLTDEPVRTRCRE